MKQKHEPVCVDRQGMKHVEIHNNIHGLKSVEKVNEDIDLSTFVETGGNTVQEYMEELRSKISEVERILSWDSE